jgi:uncharacterized damage-inducible protein DinB
MTNTTPDPTLDRMLRHMAWANAQLVSWLAAEPIETLALTAPNNEWSAGRILAHLLNAAQGYATRMEGAPRPADMETPTTTAELAELGRRLADVDARLRRQATEPEVLIGHPRPERGYDLRSTILAQSIHHATEHRAQIAGALATNGNNAIDLDAIDLWEYFDGESNGAAETARAALKIADIESAAVFVAVPPAGTLALVAAAGIQGPPLAGLVAAVQNPEHPVARAVHDSGPSFDVEPMNPGGPALRSHLPLASGDTLGVLAVAHDKPLDENARAALTKLAAAVQLPTGQASR